MADGMWAKVMGYLGFGAEDDEYEDEDDEDDAQPNGRALRELNRPLPSKETGTRTDRGRVTSFPDNRNAVPRLDLKETRAPLTQVASGAAFKMVAMHPKAFEEGQAAADHLINRRPVIVNVEGVEKDTATRIIHFLHGVVYTLHGEVQRITTHIFIFAPQGVDIDKMGMGGAATEKTDKHERSDKSSKASPTLFKSFLD